MTGLLRIPFGNQLCRERARLDQAIRDLPEAFIKRGQGT
jgi:hypothetical protein